MHNMHMHMHMHMSACVLYGFILRLSLASVLDTCWDFSYSLLPRKRQLRLRLGAAQAGERRFPTLNAGK